MALHRFKVGDKVKIFRKTKSYMDGWNDVWVDDMNNYIGREDVISDITHKGIRLKSIDFNWPWQSLELVDELFNKIKDIKI
jgi:hypothetical protein